MEDWVDVSDALRLLGVKRETLYAYVSRGHVRSMGKPGDSRASLYALPDVKRMAAKRRRPRKRADVAKSTINWGEPILETCISTVREGRLVFGTSDACELAETYSLEDIAAHHWGCGIAEFEKPKLIRLRAESAKGCAFEYLAALAPDYPAILGRRREDLRQQASQILSGFADGVMGVSFDGQIHERLGQAWGLSAAGTDLIRRALVLISDHELNASTFAVRVAASTGAALPAAALAGLSALSGPLHGVAAVNATTFLKGALAAKSPLEQYLAEAALIPGMGHNFYPQGDIRAKALLAAIDPPKDITHIIKRCAQHSGQLPNIDMAQAALAVKLDLPPDAGFVIFAIGRMSGWLAHAMEQAESGQLIRPRAVFMPEPER